MKFRIYWGVFILIILLIGGYVFLLMRNTDTEPVKVYKTDIEPTYKSSNKLSETKEFTEWWEDKKAELVSNESKQGKVILSNGQEVDETPDWNSLTPEQRQQIFNQFYIQCGVLPPPPEYTYRWKDGWVLPLLDETLIIWIYRTPLIPR